jgi:hypothetical protein
MGADKGMNSVLGPATPSIVGPYSYTHITATGANDAIKSGPGVLHCLQVNAPNAAAAVITIRDSLTSGAGSIIAVITTPASATVQVPSFVYDVVFSVGLSINVATTALDLTVSWK